MISNTLESIVKAFIQTLINKQETVIRTCSGIILIFRTTYKTIFLQRASHLQIKHCWFKELRLAHNESSQKEQ